MSILSLLVDDDELTNLINYEYCKRSGFSSHIESYSDGKSALDYLRNHPSPQEDLIVVYLDLFMPGMDGWEFIEMFSKFEDTIDVPVKFVVLTSSINKSDRIKAENHEKVFHFMSKPLTMDILRTLKSSLESGNSES